MDLRLLTTFRTIVETGSVTAAADVLLVSQPALSRQLQQLEHELGVELFLRRGRRLSLTAAGGKFLEAAVAVLKSADDAKKLAESLAGGRLTRVHMSAPTTTLNDVLAPFLAHLRPEDPLITVDEAAYTPAIAGLAAGDDLAIVTTPPPRHLRSRRLAALPVWAHVSPGQSLAGITEMSLDQLADHRLVLLDSSARSRQLIDRALTGAGLTPMDVIECRNPHVAQGLAAAGRGVAVLSDDPRFDLVPFPIRTARGLLTLTLYAAWDAGHHAAGELEHLADRLHQFCIDRYGNWTTRDDKGNHSSAELPHPRPVSGRQRLPYHVG